MDGRHRQIAFVYVCMSERGTGTREVDDNCLIIAIVALLVENDSR